MGYLKGDVVRLAGSVMLAEFGLMLCDDAGELLEMDGVVQDVSNGRVNVVIKRMMPRPAPFAWEEGCVSRWVMDEEVLEVIEGDAMLWPDAGRLKGVSDEREGVKTAPAPVFWAVGVEEMPAG
jgi:hypothetical protein